MLMQKEARRGWGQGYPVSLCLSAPPLSPLITPSPLSPQQSPWETNLSSFREGWRWERDGPRMHLVCHSHYSTSTSMGTERLQINLVLNSLYVIIHSPSLSLSLCPHLFLRPFFSVPFEHIKTCRWCTIVIHIAVTKGILNSVLLKCCDLMLDDKLISQCDWLWYCYKMWHIILNLLAISFPFT